MSLKNNLDFVLQIIFITFRSYKFFHLQGKRGIEKQPFQLPDFIAATGIEKIRQVFHLTFILLYFRMSSINLGIRTLVHNNILSIIIYDHLSLFYF